MTSILMCVCVYIYVMYMYVCVGGQESNKGPANLGWSQSPPLHTEVNWLNSGHGHTRTHTHIWEQGKHTAEVTTY